MERLNKWLCSNKLKLNIEKTKFMVINGRNVDQQISVSINGETIERVYTMKYLGFIIDCRLHLKNHIDYICKKIAKKIGFLARISSKLTPEHRVTIYKTMIAPHFEYCASILSTCNIGEFRRLQKLQNRAMRIVLRCKKRTHVQDMLDALQWLNVKQRIMYRMLVMIFKVKNNLMPKYLSDKIKYVATTMNIRYEMQMILGSRQRKQKTTENRWCISAFKNLTKCQRLLKRKKI